MGTLIKCISISSQIYNGCKRETVINVAAGNHKLLRARCVKRRARRTESGERKHFMKLMNFHGNVVELASGH